VARVEGHELQAAEGDQHDEEDPREHARDPEERDRAASVSAPVGPPPGREAAAEEASAAAPSRTVTSTIHDFVSELPCEQAESSTP
jgi:hypothetical protein